MSKNASTASLRSPKMTLTEFFSFQNVFTVRSIAVMAMMIALKIALSPLTIFLTPNFRLFSISYLPSIVVAVLYGPWASLVYGLVADTIGYFAHPQGAYFPRYAISESLASFFYACMLYRKEKVPVWQFALRALVARLLITATITFGLNFVWQAMQYGAIAAEYFTMVRVINNTIQLPFYVACITAVGRLTPVIERRAFGINSVQYQRH